LSKVLGDYAGTIDPDTLITKRHENRFELAPLRGKRLAICGELETGQRLSTKALKRISSRDDINVERKFKDAETVNPTHHIILHTNVLPIVGDARDGGTWRRLTVIPSPVKAIRTRAKKVKS
jgi:phage/plasmid-associated DNA primase